MKRRYWILAAILLALLSGPACALSGLLERSASQQIPDGSAQSAPTLYPTLTPTLTSILAPTQASPAQPAWPADDRDFRLEMTESELSEIINEEGLGQQSLAIRDLDVRITEQNVIATFIATHADSGLSGEITVVALPQVVDGKLYLRIVDHSLGSGFGGFGRLIANALINTAIDRINTTHGIPIVVGGVTEITSVELLPGLLVITGTLE